MDHATINPGINLNTVPVLDVTHPKTSKVIGSRSYSANPSTVSIIGNTCINHFHIETNHKQIHY